jgi:hypothetical protein
VKIQWCEGRAVGQMWQVCPFQLCDGLIGVQICECPDIFMEGIPREEIVDGESSDYVFRISGQSSLLFSLGQMFTTLKFFCYRKRVAMIFPSYDALLNCMQSRLVPFHVKKIFVRANITFLNGKFSEY